MYALFGAVHLLFISLTSSPFSSTSTTTVTRLLLRHLPHRPRRHSAEMAAVFRPPLAPRTAAQTQSTIAVHAAVKTYPSILKRPRSPEPHSLSATQDIVQVKRHRTQSATTKENVDKQQRRAEREAREDEFRAKYTKAFPSWVFYFDTTDTERDALAPRILLLNGVRP